MILVNDKQVEFTKFPDGTTSFRFSPHLPTRMFAQPMEPPIFSITWKYDNDEETPSDGLCGKTDEDNLGFTYMQLDNYIMHGSSGDEDIDKVIAKKHTQNLHKLNPMPAYGSQP